MVIDLARDLGVQMMITLGSLLADVPHTRPSPVTGGATDPELVERLGLQRSRYEGPTGIVGVLHDACNRADIPSVSLWSAVPHYVSLAPSPRARTSRRASRWQRSSRASCASVSVATAGRSAGRRNSPRNGLVAGDVAAQEHDVRAHERKHDVPGADPHRADHRRPVGRNAEEAVPGFELCAEEVWANGLCSG